MILGILKIIHEDKLALLSVVSGVSRIQCLDSFLADKQLNACSRSLFSPIQATLLLICLDEQEYCGAGYHEKIDKARC